MTSDLLPVPSDRQTFVQPGRYVVRKVASQILVHPLVCQQCKRVVPAYVPGDGGRGLMIREPARMDVQLGVRLCRERRLRERRPLTTRVEQVDREPILVLQGRRNQRLVLGERRLHERAEILNQQRILGGDPQIEMIGQQPDALDLDVLVAQTEGFSGAEIEQVVVSSLFRSLHEDRPLETETIQTEIHGTIPLSVSRREDIHRLRALCRERFVPVA